MGNGNAVEFGQAAHCGLAALSGALEDSEVVKAVAVEAMVEVEKVEATAEEEA